MIEVTKVEQWQEPTAGESHGEKVVRIHLPGRDGTWISFTGQWTDFNSRTPAEVRKVAESVWNSIRPLAPNEFRKDDQIYSCHWRRRAFTSTYDRCVIRPDGTETIGAFQCATAEWGLIAVEWFHRNPPPSDEGSDQLTREEVRRVEGGICRGLAEALGVYQLRDIGDAIDQIAALREEHGLKSKLASDLDEENGRLRKEIRARDGILPIGGMAAGGLGKLIEECGEVLQVAGKIMASPTREHWDGKGDLFKRLEDELADVIAAAKFVADKFGVPATNINKRIDSKIKKFWHWDRGEP